MYWIERNSDRTGYQLVKEHEEHYGMTKFVHAENESVGGLAVKVAAMVKEQKIEGAHTRTPECHNHQRLNEKEEEEFWRMFYKSI